MKNLKLLVTVGLFITHIHMPQALADTATTINDDEVIGASECPLLNDRLDVKEGVV